MKFPAHGRPPRPANQRPASQGPARDAGLLDTALEVPAPEGIEIALHPAGPFARASAWLVDLLLRVGVLLLLLFGVAVLGKFGWALILLAWFFLEWIFPAWCEVNWGGATPGKKALGLIVVHDDGTPVGWPAALTRNLLRFVDFLPLFYLFGLASMVLSRDFRRLGDHAAGTLVVYRFPAGSIRRVPPGVPEAPAAALTAREQRAVLDYAERIADLTPERAAELAEIVGPLVGEARGDAAVARLVGVAQHLVGHR
jgi:uncharacterized RDD family membrane protein YckC